MSSRTFEKVHKTAFCLDTSRLRRSLKEEVLVWLGGPGGPAEPYQHMKEKVSGLRQGVLAQAV